MNPETTIGTVDNTGADLVPLPSAPLPAVPSAPLPEAVREYVRASKAENTLRGYQSDWRDFYTWCESRGGLCPLPAAADTVAAYIAECAGHLKPGSIQRRLNAIAEAHKAAGLDSPTHAAIVRNTLKGIRRTLGTAPAQKTAALTDEIHFYRPETKVFAEFVVKAATYPHGKSIFLTLTIELIPPHWAQETEWPG